MKINFVIIFLISFYFSACEQPIPRKPIVHKSNNSFKQSVLLNKKINEIQIKWIQQYIKNDKNQVYKSNSHGFWYTFLKKSTSAKKVSKGDKLIYQYNVFKLNDEYIYQSKNDTYWVDKEPIIEGLYYGFKNLHEGDEVKFLFPSNVAFGVIGDHQKIGINEPIIIKVKLNKIKKNESN